MDLQLNADRFSGQDFVQLYDQYRPVPPDDIFQQALRYLQLKKAERIVDLGCGTGLATLALKDFAQEVIGIEPSADMRGIAQKKLGPATTHIRFENGFGHDLPLDNESVDILCISQAFHWMEPTTTLTEINRVLKPGGVLLICDAVWPPTCHWKVEQAYVDLFENIKAITQSLNETVAKRFPKRHHQENIQNSGHFRYVSKKEYHLTEKGTAQTIEGNARSQGGMQELFDRGYTEETIGLSRFCEVLYQHKKQINTITYHYITYFAIK